MAHTYSGVAHNSTAVGNVIDDRFSSAPGQLASGYFVPAYNPLSLVYPRPDNETQAWAVHRRWFTGIPFEIPMGVQMGDFPYRWFLGSECPSGMTIGTILGSDGYGILSWANPTAGTHTCVIYCVGQSLNSITIRFTLTIVAPTLANGLVVADIANGDDTTGTGDITNPFKTFNKIRVDFNTTSSFPNYTLILRSGTYAIGGSVTLGQMKVSNILPYPSEDVTIICTAGTIFPVGGNASGTFKTTSGTDSFIGKIKLQTAATTANDHFFFIDGTSPNRITFYGVQFSDIGAGSVGNDNPGAIQFDTTNDGTQYAFAYGCTLTDTAVQLLETYYCKNILVDLCTLNNLGSGKTSTGNNGSQGFHMKSDTNNSTFRRLTVLNMNTSNAGQIGLAGNEVANKTGYDNLEVCYCTGISPDITQQAFWVAVQNDFSSRRNFYMYRNTFLGICTAHDYTYTLTLKNNILISDRTPIIPASGTSSIIIDDDNLTGNGASGIIDSSTGLLIGSSRTAWLGQRGAEFA